MPKRIASDMMKTRRKRMEYMMGEYEEFPVDLYGKRIFPDKNDPNNLENASRDIQDYFGLDERGVE